MLQWWMTKQREQCSGSFTFPGWSGYLGSAGSGGGLALDEILLDSQYFSSSARHGLWQLRLGQNLSQREKF